MTSNSSEARRPLDVLLVEDNPGDVRLFREAMRENRTRSKLHTAPDGAEAMRFLRREGPYGDVPVPDVVLLDLNLPKKDGRQVLAEIKGDPELRHIPVVVLTSSSAREDIAQAYSLHANCYITKPTDLDQFLSVAQSIETFWFGTAQLAKA